MTFNLEPKPRRAGEASGCFSRMMGLARILGGILFFALPFNSIQAPGATVPAGQLALAWSPSPDASVTGYNIYYGVASLTYTNKVNAGNVTNTTISGLVAGVTYYFAATAYDGLGQESDYSDEISYTVPAESPAVQLRTAANGQFVLTVSGSNGKMYDIEATQDFLAWTVIGTVTLDASGSLDFTDTNAPNFSQRFYRTELKN